ncbi:MAG: hypothetical protein Q7S66_00675 [bacterium]|nr:hypothetical protein [bacterium]
MQIKILKAKVAEAEHFMRRAGYGRLFDRRSQHVSFVKRIHGDLYPRFHVYIKDEGENWTLNLHLDQRATMYEGVTAHSGEYEGTAVEKEAARIIAFLPS